MGLSFQEIATRIVKINLHEKFLPVNLSIMLIGFKIQKGNDKDNYSYHYSPMDEKMLGSTQGIYLVNNKRISSLVQDKQEFNKLIKEIDHLDSPPPPQVDKRSALINQIKRRTNKVETEDFLVDEEAKLSKMQVNYYNDDSSNLNNASIEPISKKSAFHKNNVSRQVPLSNITTTANSKKVKIQSRSIMKCLDFSFKAMHLYKANLKSYVIDPNNIMTDNFKNHILICGYKEGLNYYIEAIRTITNVPICIIANPKLQIKIVKLYRKYRNVFYFKDDLTDINCLEVVMVKDCQHVIILSSIEDKSSNIDFDGVMISNYLQENYPHVKF